MIFSKSEVLASLLQQKILPVFHHNDPEVCGQLVHALYEIGFRSMAFRNKDVFAADVFEKLKSGATIQYPDFILGVENAFSIADARVYHQFKADFTIQPICNAEVGEYCRENNMLWIPGSITINEIYFASIMGSSLSNITQAATSGPHYIQYVKNIMQETKLMISGFTLQPNLNIKTWQDHGADLIQLDIEFPDGTLTPSKDFITNVTAMLKKLV